ncbi:hypothetical protein ACLBX9_19325 [Methylobacterium sp. A49B]|uniref:Ribbon-helix-helix protein, CopG family n=1 Tax=Methylobacterium mesophilicum SR1.6/6 TaxID=908290 RepID=A0A6B9FT13_9HYPH|nr:hypothetical protein [Methylobacterium mesophilicum]QGY05731.1 hypothetical protein MMSR116_30415 [Methylobacterium mesophilicum SR1.6/6]
MGRDSTVIQVRTDSRLRTAFTEAVQREHTTTSDVLRQLMQQYVRDSLRREAARQSRVVTAAPDAAESLALIEDVQDLDDA